jgi:hypothetical protein
MRRPWRRLPVPYLLGIFLGAAFAPHHHLDPIADLLSDRPSNSGTFVRIEGPVGLQRGVYPGALVQDESCFACFHSDFVVSPAVPISAIAPFARALHRAFSTTRSAPSILLSDSVSRAPPGPA